ncbi:MAG: hypothetical protein NTZ95_01620, partial [Candidatus Omnitrophica bacterium]|nr:hypothetical protein [Candidatus Omnitrophota bacterium]
MSVFPRDRKILGKLSVILAFAIIYFVFTSSDPYPSIIALNISILLAWMIFGIFRGSAVSLFS